MNVNFSIVCVKRSCPEVRRPLVTQRAPTITSNATWPSTIDTGPFDYVDEDGASVIALRRRKRTIDYHGVQPTKIQLAHLISDLTWSMDQPLATHRSESTSDSNLVHYEIRQIQQQFTIESPLTQNMHKHKTAYGSK
jgi:hypothetical protein